MQKYQEVLSRKLKYIK